MIRADGLGWREMVFYDIDETRPVEAPGGNPPMAAVPHARPVLPAL